MLMDLPNGRYYTLNEVGGLVWQALRDRTSLEELLARLSRDYSVPLDVIRSDTAAVLGQLEQANLIARA